MLLRQIKLQNIRSYAEEIISFPPGATLLSGDIGAGKSTILQAIEFALFGASRTELPAEALLRKGAIQGSVELQFSLKGQNLIIQRHLKKEKETIKQTVGSIILNNSRKDLTPVEMKAEILSLLGYPEEYLTKTSNYIYRYTVYTPQEEMKKILFEKPDDRLDTLRKIFNIDKYKTIRENLQTYLQTLRTKIAVRRTKMEQWEDQEHYAQLLEQQCRQAETALQELQPLLVSLRQMTADAQLKLDQLELEQRQFVELQQRQRMLLAILAEKNQQLTGLQQQEAQCALQIEDLRVPEGHPKEKIPSHIHSLEQQRIEFITTQSRFQERMKSLRQEMMAKQQQLKELEEQTASLEEKEKLAFLLTEESRENQSLSEKLKQLEELLAKTLKAVTENETLLYQSRQLHAKMETLRECPLCLQQVSEQHKHSILVQEELKIKAAENLLFELNKNKSSILQQREEVLQKLELLHQKEIVNSKTKAEVLQLQEKRILMLEVRTAMKMLEEEYASLSRGLQQITFSSPIEGIDRDIAKLRKALELLVKKEQWQQQLKWIHDQITVNVRQVKEVSSQLDSLQQILLQHRDQTELMVQQQKALKHKSEEEKKASLQEVQWKAKLEVLLKSAEEARKVVLALEQEKKALVQEQQLHHWLKEYFIPLTVSIEKQVMIKIHYLFNQLFQEWFSILIDNEGISARIDDSFSPVVEQNGYEIAFLNLSGGEKTSASLAYRLALNRVINDVIHDIKTKDLLILDEPTDGFSSEQLDKVREVLDKLSLRQTIIVSHESKIESFVENVVRIGKEGNASKVMR